MNKYMQVQWPIIQGTHALRNGVLETLNDSDLAFNPGGQNMTLGALCRELGEIEYSYLHSLKTLKQDWSYHNPDPALENSLTALKGWFESLDTELEATVSDMTDEELERMVERGPDFSLPVNIQLEVYLQALLIFLGKATIFLKAMNRPLPPQVQEWIG